MPPKIKSRHTEEDFFLPYTNCIIQQLKYQTYGHVQMISVNNLSSDFVHIAHWILGDSDETAIISRILG
jgi:hypothetical protein